MTTGEAPAARVPGQERPRILLLHGFFSCAAAWDRLRACLQNDADTIAPPQLGYGGAHGCGSYTLDSLVEYLAPIVEREKPTHVIGHSMGSIVALALAREFPQQFERVGVVGLPVFYDRQDGTSILRQRGLVYRLFLQDDDRAHVACVAMNRVRNAWAPFTKLVLPRQPREAVVGAFDHCRSSHKGGLSHIVFSGQVESLAEQVKTPVVALHGARDRTAPPDRAEALARRVGWEFVLAPDQGHQNVVERPVSVARWVRERVLARGDETGVTGAGREQAQWPGQPALR